MTTHAATKRGGRGITAVERAKRLSDFQARIAAREAADPSTPFHKLFKLAAIGALSTGPQKLSDHYEVLRRCYALRAWCAIRCARALGDDRSWYAEARDALRWARSYRRLAAGTRKEGR